MYTQFANVYDELMADVDYQAWAEQYAGMMAYFGVGEGMVAECACGTGGLTIPLCRMNYRVTGVDQSADMLFEASKKARRAGLAIPFVKQDMRRLKLHRPMDAILCTCDGMNYLTSEADVKAFLQAAYEAIRPGGGLFFDISTPHKIENILGNNLMMQDGGRITYLWSNAYSPRTRLVKMDLCIFTRGEDGRYDRMDESQTQRAHTREELARWLVECGFTPPGIYGRQAMAEPKEDDERWHFAAIKRVI